MRVLETNAQHYGNDSFIGRMVVLHSVSALNDGMVI